MTESDSSSEDDERRSALHNFGHVRNGWAVEFTIAGIACRSLTVETKREAETIRYQIEQEEDTSNIEVVRDE